MSELHPCCDPTSPTAIWEGMPTGRIIEIDGIETYISQPGKRDGQPDSKPFIRHPQGQKEKSSKRVILFLTEGHGIYLPNAQLLADSFASHLDCDVLMPDEFAGQARLDKHQRPFFPPGKEPVPETVPWTEDKDDPNYELRGIKVPFKENTETSDAYPFRKPPWWKGDESAQEFEAWKGRHEPPATDPLIARVVKYIHDTYGQDVKIGGVGYCFGGRYVIRLMGSGVIDVGVINHPSFFTMEEVGKLTKAKRLAIYAAETDKILPPEKRRQTEDVLTKTGATWASTVFSGTRHGFSVRGDMSVKEVRLAKESAFTGAVSWFEAWL
ncbi:alpha/beta-hydrolase [Hyaloscypha variabilis]